MLIPLGLLVFLLPLSVTNQLFNPDQVFFISILVSYRLFNYLRNSVICVLVKSFLLFVYPSGLVYVNCRLRIKNLSLHTLAWFFSFREKGVGFFCFDYNTKGKSYYGITYNLVFFLHSIIC